MKQPLVIVLCAVASFGLPGVLDIGKLFGGVGLLGGVEKLLTNSDASPRATESTGLSHSSEADTIHDKGEPDGQSTSLTVHSSTAADVSTDTSNSQRSIGNSGTLGQMGIPESATRQSTGQDTLTQKGALEIHSTFSGVVGASEDMDEDASRAGVDESPTTTSNAQRDGGPKTVVHTQFVVVAPGERSTLIISEPESFSAIDNLAHAPALPLSPICMALLSISIALY